MKGHLIGVFGVRQQPKEQFLNSVAKKSEAEGIIVYAKNESGVKYSFLDDTSYPDRIQGYARIAAICDYAYYFFPSDAQLTAADGELAILLDSFDLEGAIQLVDGSADAVQNHVKTAFTGLKASSYPLLERDSRSSVIDLITIRERNVFPAERALIYVDRVFNVKGVGVVALGFILSGKVSVHDNLRPLPSTSGKMAEVKGIQINDEDYDVAQRGVRVGLALKGVEAKDLEKTSWFDDGTFPLSRSLTLDFRKSVYYRQPVANRDIHIQCNGETLPAQVEQNGDSSRLTLHLSNDIPYWEKMPTTLLDLNAKQLRVIGGGTVTMTS